MKKNYDTKYFFSNRCFMSYCKGFHVINTTLCLPILNYP